MASLLPHGLVLLRERLGAVRRGSVDEAIRGLRNPLEALNDLALQPQRDVPHVRAQGGVSLARFQTYRFGNALHLSLEGGNTRSGLSRPPAQAHARHWLVGTKDLSTAQQFRRAGDAKCVL